MLRLIGTLAVVVAAAAVAVMPASADTGYSITDLQTLGGILSAASAINDDGIVVGDADTVDEFHAFRWNGTLTDLQTLGGPGSSAADVNSSGQIVGFSYTNSLDLHAFLYSDAGGMDDLNGLLGSLESVANAINDGGAIAGGIFVGPGQLHPFLLSGSSVTDLGTFGGTWGQALDVNNAGVVVGSAYTSSGQDRAFLYDSADAAPQLIDIGALSGGTSSAFAINEAGVVVGASLVAADYHAFRADPGGPLADLGTLGGTYSSANDVNDLGQIVGAATTSGGDQHAFLHSPGGPLIDLNDLLPAGSPWTLFSADGINNKGQIVGTGSIGGEQHAFVLEPNTAPGAGVSVQPVDETTGSMPVTLTFQNVTVPGGTTLTTSAAGPSPPAGFSLGSPATYYELATTASFTGTITICVDSTGISFTGPPTLWHYEGGSWTNVTTTVNGSTVCGSVTSLSPFALLAGPPAATYEICLLYDPTKAHRRGSTVPIKLRLCDRAGTNLSSESVAVHAAGIRLVSTNATGAVEDSGNANPDGDFRYDAGIAGYVYNLSTRGLGIGTYALEFTVAGASHVYEVSFQLQ
jgi:probable HAF family extracellular repeat protein